jgi:hypothetical protein
MVKLTQELLDSVDKELHFSVIVPSFRVKLYIYKVQFSNRYLKYKNMIIAIMLVALLDITVFVIRYYMKLLKLTD